MNRSSFSPLSRRQFIQRSSLATAVAAAPLVLPSRLLGQNAPSKKITIGVIGCGNISTTHFPVLLGSPESVRVLAVADVDQERRDQAAARVNKEYGNNDCKAYADFRELNRRSDIDAVFVCTPDHWHALISIDAMRHGKDVYCEKPLTLTIAEGRAMVETARKHQRICQHGTQHRSMKRFHDVSEFVRNNGLGKLSHIECWIPPNNRHCGATWKPEAVPEGLDWEMWLGPAPWRPFNSLGYHYNFRFISESAYGQVTNWGAHYLDIGQWALDMDNSGPVEVEGHGEFPSSGLFTNATKVDFTVRYANGVPMFCRTRYEGGGTSRFVGERGWLDISRGSMSASDNNLLREMQANKGAVKLELSNNHHENFFECIRTRKRPIADVELGHRTTTVCNLGQIAMVLGRKLKWNPAKEEFVGDDMANRLRTRAMRAPWSLA
ncbi:MAG: Gfo/Idh/MocA family oxidoreductase [Verrucomicrobia bacterium]|nr:Gfo/Idh/MocA family oxidoreductase [Verrucomicrobiota bacterium]